MSCATEGTKMAKKKTLAELKAEKEEADAKYYAELKATLEEEFHSVWSGTIKPALQSLKRTMDEVTDRFQDFEDEFKGYLRAKEPDVDVNLLAEIYGDTLGTKESSKQKKPSRSDKRNWSEQTKIGHVKAYDKAKKKRQGGQYLRDNDLNASNISAWRAAFLAAMEVSDKP
jgi:hypothetical protein